MFSDIRKLSITDINAFLTGVDQYEAEVTNQLIEDMYAIQQVHKFNKKKRFPEKRLPGTAVAVENGNVDKAIRKLKKKTTKRRYVQ